MAKGFWRTIKLGLPTLLGLARRGYFIPYRYAAHVRPIHRYAAAEARFASLHAAFRLLLADVEDYRVELMAIGADAPAPQPRWDQDWFATLDAAILYAIVRRRRPKRLIEIGSGHSTRFAARAIADGGLATLHVAIDPSPRAPLVLLPVDWRRMLLEDCDGAIFAELEPGDILFIDSSHILMPGTDVDRLINNVLPRLPAGVLVHVHDVFLPDDYPADWAWRGYNEQLAVLPLMTSGAYRPLFASRYVQTRMQKETAASLVATLPGFNNLATSLWLEKA